MASAKFLEEALSTDVDESAVNAIVGSLENQFNSASSSSLQNNYVNESVSNNIAARGNSIIGTQKYHADQSSSSDGKIAFNNNQQSFQSTFVSAVSGPQSNLSVSKPNETFKVIQTTQALPTVTSNRITFPAQCLSNGSIVLTGNQNIVHAVPSGGIVTQGANKTITMQPPLVIKQASAPNQVGIQQGMVTVPMSVTSSMPASIPNVMTLTKPGQNVVASTQNMQGTGQPTIIPNVQIVNMRPGTPGVSAQKSVATVSPRVVIGAPQVVGARAAAPGITLQTLQGLQPGQQGHLLLKTENGQYQLLRVGPAPAANTLTPQAQTIRLSTVPPQPGVATVSTSVPAAQIAAQMPQQVPTPVVAAPAPQQPQPPVVTTQKPSDNTKEKCRNFLANLLVLSSKEPKSVEINVRTLIQELIDAKVDPEEFCTRLEELLKASPQPCLIGFLKKSLPLLRPSLVTKELVIDGINPPAPHIAFSNVAAPSQPIIVTSNMANEALVNGVGTALTTLMPPVLPVSLTPSLVHTQPGKINIISATQIQAGQPNPGVQKQGNTIAVLQNIPIPSQKINLNKVSSPKAGSLMGKTGFNRQSGSAALNTVLTPGKSLLKEKEKKSHSQYSSQQFVDDKMGDDDINDVAAMGGVNLAEESQRILGSTEMIGTQIRSCKDEYLVPMGIMQARIKSATARHGLEEPSGDVAAILSHAVNDHLKNLVEKLAVIAQHRIDLNVKTDPRYEVTQDVKGQLKFLEELDRVEKKRREDMEREILLRAAKSRSKNEDPEQAKLKAKAKEMQRAELEELRQREANLTALQAIGPRKKPKLDGMGGLGDSISNGSGNSGGFNNRSQMALRTRLKRINQRDLLFLLEQERDTAHSSTLYKYYLK